jgi:hypothetical protein
MRYVSKRVVENVDPKIAQYLNNLGQVVKSIVPDELTDGSKLSGEAVFSVHLSYFIPGLDHECKHSNERFSFWRDTECFDWEENHSLSNPSCYP